MSSIICATNYFIDKGFSLIDLSYLTYRVIHRFIYRIETEESGSLVVQKTSLPAASLIAFIFVL
jgi:hypothetical protein